jgi:hypothetical protein
VRTPIGQNEHNHGIWLLTPDEAIAELKRRADLIPLENIQCFANVPGAPEELCDRHVELMATVVGPALANVGIPTTWL